MLNFDAGRTRGALSRGVPGIFVVVLLPVLALGWVFPEHRDIAVLAVQKLSPSQQGLLQQLWSDARVGYEARLCEQAADPAQGPAPTCIDYAAWTAIARSP